MKESHLPIKPFSARERLESFGNITQRLHRLTRELAKARANAQEDPAAAHWQRRVQLLQKDIRTNRLLLSRRQQELEGLLARLPNEAERQVLALRYLGLYSYQHISETLAYSDRHIFRLHTKGIKRLDAILSGIEG